MEGLDVDRGGSKWKARKAVIDWRVAEEGGGVNDVS